MIRAFIFDMDGVLADSTGVPVELVKNYFSSLGTEIDGETVRRNLGKGMEALFSSAASERKIAVDTAAALSYAEKAYPLMMKNVSPVKGAAETVRKARSAGMMTAVASSDPAWKVKADIRSTGLDESDFDLILAGGDVRRGKPCPDIYLLSCIKLGIAPEEALVFEGSLSGTDAALSAGCRCAAMCGSLERAEAERSGAEYVFDGFESFPDFSSPSALEEVLSGIPRRKSGTEKYGAVLITPSGRPITAELEKKAVGEAMKAMYNAYCPYSKFSVGAAVVSARSGRIYSGCNVENASFGATICAERNAITTAVASEGKIGIDLVVICSRSVPPAQPCAVCLQVMSEFIRPETPVVLVSEDGREERYRFSSLLPHPFDFGDPE